MKLFVPIAACAMLAAVAPAAPRRPARTATIDVTVTNDRFIPARIVMKRSTPYVLRIHNRSNRKHNFAAKDFFTQARVAQADSGWVTDDKVDLAAGQSATLHIVAPDTPNAAYPYRSTNLLDATEKLKGTILVR